MTNIIVVFKIPTPKLYVISLLRVFKRAKHIICANNLIKSHNKNKKARYEINRMINVTIKIIVGGNDSGRHATRYRGHATPRALQRVGYSDRVPSDVTLATGIRGRAGLQTRLHHMVQGSRIF